MGRDSENNANAKIVTKLLFRLLPVQILLAAVGAVNGIVSSVFASNFVGTDAMSAVGLYSPLNMLVSSIGAILVGGSVIQCGKYMGQNRQVRMHNVFSLNLVLTFLVAAFFTVLFIVMGLFGLTGFFTKNETVRSLFNSYLLGQSIGILPMLLGSSFSAFLSLENKGRRSFIASIIYIGINLLLNWLFVQVLKMEAFGLVLASSLGMWVFMLVQAQYYVSGKSHLRFSIKRLAWHESREIFSIGLMGALANLYQTARGLIVNRLLESFVGGAVDLTLLDMKTGKELDMGSPFDLFSEKSHPDYRGITDEQFENRMTLQRAMVRNGFEPIDCEWWHFRLKDEPYPDTYFEFPVSSDYLRR